MGSVKSRRGTPSVYLMVLLVFASMFSILLPAKNSQALDPQISFVRSVPLSTPELDLSPVSMTIDSDGNFYIIDSTFCQIKKLSPTRELIDSWGSCGSSDGQFNAPQDIAIDSQDNIYVLDLNNYRIEKFSSDGTFILKWGSNGSGDGQFSNMRRLVIDHEDNVYVSANNRIQKFSSAGSFITKWGSSGTGNSQFNIAEKMAVDSDNNIYVVDVSNIRIQKFSSAGSYITQWGASGTGNGQFTSISTAGIAIDANDVVYVADGRVGIDRIQTFTTAGSYAGQWDLPVDEQGRQFSTPWHIQPADDHLYLVDVGSGRIEEITTAGAFVSYIGNYGGLTPDPVEVTSDAEGNLYIADQANLQVQKRNEAGSYLSKLYSYYPSTFGPNAIAIGPTGNIYAAFSLRNIVQVYSPTYELLDTIGTYTGSIVGSSADGEFYDPQGVAVDSQGNIYVTDRNNYRVQKFDSNGNFIKKWGSQGINPGQFSNGGSSEGPQGIAVDGDDNVYVSDPGMDRIQKFTSNGEYLMSFNGWEYGYPVNVFDRGTYITPAVDEDGNQYRQNTSTQEIIKTNAGGTELLRWGEAGTGPGQFNLLADTYTKVVVYNDEVYVADTGNNRIQVFDLDGEYVRSIGEAGSGDGQLQIVTDFLFDSDGHLQVVDAFNARIQTFMPDGTYMSQWGQGDAGDSATIPLWIFEDTDGNGDFYVSSLTAQKLYQYDRDSKVLLDTITAPVSFLVSSGTEPGWLKKPRDVTVDQEGYIYVADSDNDRIQVYAPNGTFVTTWGTMGSGEGQFNNPQSVTVGADNQVWVADVGNKRVEQFTVSLPPLVVTPDPDPDPDPTSTPTPPAGETPVTSPVVASNRWVSSGLFSPETPSLPSDTSIILTVQPNTTFDENRPLLTGYTIPFGWVEVTVYSTPQTGKVQANAAGFWQWQPPEPLEPGSHRYEARLVNADGTYGKVTESVAFTISGPRSSTPETEDQLTPSTTENEVVSNRWFRELVIGVVSLAALLLAVLLWQRFSS